MFRSFCWHVCGKGDCIAARTIFFRFVDSVAVTLVGDCLVPLGNQGAPIDVQGTGSDALEIQS